ncbi:MAG: hypothetical protein ABFD12_00245, partial [Syntrophorhabdus sp.]
MDAHGLVDVALVGGDILAPVRQKDVANRSDGLALFNGDDRSALNATNTLCVVGDEAGLQGS